MIGLINKASGSGRNGLLLSLMLVLLLGVGYFLTPATLSLSPALQFTTLTGESYTLKSLQGRPVLISFWASDCAPCLAEIPALKSIYQQYSTQGLMLIAVAMSYDPPNQVLKTVQEAQIPYPVALDPDNHLATAFAEVKFTPSLFLLNQQGQVVYQNVGQWQETEIHVQLDKLHIAR
jgi:thiol-disulfide isomerase/thioredoxin